MVLTDHSQSLRVAHGLSPKRIGEQIEAVRKLNKKLKGITVLTGSEVDILADGSLDYPDDILKELDFVVASVHSGFRQSKAEITRRIVRAMRNKHVRLIAHPTGRLIGEREAYEVDLEEVFEVARETHTALEINGQPSRLDLNDVHAQGAREAGVMLAVDADAHSTEQFDCLAYGIGQARRAGCERKHILNTLSLHELRKKIAGK